MVYFYFYFFLNGFSNTVSCDVQFSPHGTKGSLCSIRFCSFIQKQENLMFLKCLVWELSHITFAIVNNKPVPYLLSEFPFSREGYRGKPRTMWTITWLNDEPIRSQVLVNVELRSDDNDGNRNRNRVIVTCHRPPRMQPIRGLLDGSFI